MFAAESLDAVFAADAAFELEEPIVRVCIPELAGIGTAGRVQLKSKGQYGEYG